MMTLNERISKIIEYSQLSPSEFADEIDVQRSSISHITSGRNKPSLDFLIKVKERFPELQWDWIINNVGEMLLTEENKVAETPKATTSLPDLFALIDDDVFGQTESEDRVQKSNPSESDIAIQKVSQEKILDSQRLENKEIPTINQVTENQGNKIKRIVIFYESGKFESFEP